MPTIQEINQTLLSASLATLKMTYERLAAAANTDVQTEHLLWRLQFIYGKLIDSISSFRSYLLCKVVWG